MKLLFDHPRTTKIVQLVGVLFAIFVFLSGKLSKPAGATGQPAGQWTATDTFWLLVIALFTLSGAILAIVRHRHSGVIRSLSALQGAYILNPRYVTASEHSSRSKEGKLAKNATANILTNSLKYDIFYAEEIAKNMIRGATYIYLLPYTSAVIADLRNYITNISEKLEEQLRSQSETGILTRLQELQAKNLEFCFFANSNPCLYNFAIFRQTAEGGLEHFVQYWWYINPSGTNSDGHMLTYEIEDNRDRVELDSVFAEIKQSSSKSSGRDIFDQRTNLEGWIRNKR